MSCFANTLLPRVVLISVLALPCGYASSLVCSAQNSSPNDPAGAYRIAGVLVNSVTGEPVRRGVVQAVEDSGHVAAACITDNDGRFSLERLAAAKYQLTASKRGSRVQAYDEHDEFATSIVTGPGQDTTHLDFKLTPDAVLYGTVTDDDGEPVKDARVMLFKRPSHPGSGERIASVNGASTDDTGTYEIANILAGEYLIAVVAEPWYAIHDGAAAKRNSALDVAYPVTYFDSTTEERAATPIELSGGMRQEVNVSLHAVPALHISITSPRKPEGSPDGAELQQVIFGNVVGEVGDRVNYKDTGTLYVDGVTPGQYQLTMQGDSERVVDLSLTSSVDLDPGSASPSNAVAGSVRMANGTDVQDRMTVSLERMDDGPGQNQYATEARQGRFRFDSITPGEYALSVTGGEKLMPVIAISAGGSKQAGNLIKIGERTPEVVVTLSEADTRVEGFARKDGKGFAGAMMVLLPKNPARWKALTRRDQSDSDGSFAFRDVAPGEYTAIAIEDGWPLDWTSPAAMARYLAGGTNVTLTGNSGKLVQLSSPVAVEQR